MTGFPPKPLTFDDKCHPYLLRQLYDPLYVLYVKGEISLINDFSIAMVRTWQSIIYGRLVAKMLAGQFVASGAMLVSGGARGIDSVKSASNPPYLVEQNLRT